MRVAAGYAQELVLVDVILKAPKRSAVGQHHAIGVADPQSTRVENDTHRIDELRRHRAGELVVVEQAGQRRAPRHEPFNDADVGREKDVRGGGSRRCWRRRHTRPARRRKQGEGVQMHEPLGHKDQIV